MAGNLCSICGKPLDSVEIGFGKSAHEACRSLRSTSPGPPLAPQAIETEGSLDEGIPVPPTEAEAPLPLARDRVSVPSLPHTPGNEPDPRFPPTPGAAETVWW